MKSNLLYVAMFLLILCMPIRGNEEGVRWLWADLLWVPLGLVIAALLCIAVYVFRKEQERKGTQSFVES